MPSQECMEDRMSVALRVLTFNHDHTNPLQSDIESLQCWVGAESRSADHDELARIIIGEEIERVKKSRYESRHGEEAEAPRTERVAELRRHVVSI
jgi:hypothetical protein